MGVFIKPAEIVSASLFYKNFQAPIEATFIPLSQNPLLTWRNVDEAAVYGLELELRKGLDFISGSLNAFNIGINLTLVQSEVSIGEAELKRKRGFNPGMKATRPMAGQSPYILNSSLGYKTEKTEMNLVFNVQGKRLAFVSPDATPDIYEKPVPGLTFNISRNLSEGWKAKISASNLLNSDVEFVQEYKGEEYIYQKYRRGRDVNVGISYSIL